jgi:hypothetical protein
MYLLAAAGEVVLAGDVFINTQCLPKSSFLGFRLEKHFLSSYSDLRYLIGEKLRQNVH